MEAKLITLKEWDLENKTMKLNDIICNNPSLGYSKTIDLVNVSDIIYSGAFNVEFIQVSSEQDQGFAVALSDNEELLEYIAITVSGQELQIKCVSPSIINTRSGTRVINTDFSNDSVIIINGNQVSNVPTLQGTVKIVVVLPTLSRVRSSGAGEFYCSSLTGDSLELNLSGVGGINLAGQVSNVEVKLTGAGNINLKKLISDTATLKLSGVGKIKSHVTKSVIATVSGVGDIKIYGNPIDRKVSKSGLGKIKFK